MVDTTRVCGTCSHFKPWDRSMYGSCEAPMPQCAEVMAEVRADDGAKWCACWKEARDAE